MPIPIEAYLYLNISIIIIIQLYVLYTLVLLHQYLPAHIWYACVCVCLYTITPPVLSSAS